MSLPKVSRSGFICLLFLSFFFSLVFIFYPGIESAVVASGTIDPAWVKVRDLKTGDWLRTKEGWTEIKSIEYLPEPVTVYNLTVSEPNTFFANGILAHNKNGGESQAWGRVYDQTSGEYVQREVQHIKITDSGNEYGYFDWSSSGQGSTCQDGLDDDYFYADLDDGGHYRYCVSPGTGYECVGTYNQRTDECSQINTMSCCTNENSHRSGGDMTKFIIRAKATPPENFTCTCGNDMVMTLSWDPVAGAESYPFRIQDDTEGEPLRDECDEQDDPVGNYCSETGYPETSFSIQAQPEHYYTTWVHSYLDGEWSDPAVAYCNCPLQVPNCKNLTGPAEVVVGQEYNYSFEAEDYKGVVTAVGLYGACDFIPNWTKNGPAKVHNFSKVKFNSPGDYTLCCRAWNDAIAEARGDPCGEGPPVFEAVGPDACMNVTAIVAPVTPTPTSLTPTPTSLTPTPTSLTPTPTSLTPTPTSTPTCPDCPRKSFTPVYREGEYENGKYNVYVSWLESYGEPDYYNLYGCTGDGCLIDTGTYITSFSSPCYEGFCEFTDTGDEGTGFYTGTYRRYKVVPMKEGCNESGCTPDVTCNKPYCLADGLVMPFNGCDDFCEVERGQCDPNLNYFCYSDLLKCRHQDCPDEADCDCEVPTPTLTPTPTSTPTPMSTPTPGPWFQTRGGDVHSEENLSSSLPLGKYFSLALDNYPGVVSCGDQSPHFGEGSVSEKGWLASDTSGLPLSSYDYFDRLLKNPTEIDQIIIKLDSLRTDVYKYDGTGTVFIDGEVISEKIIILIGEQAGGVTVRRDITVEEGGFLAVISKKDIKIQNRVNSIQGVFITDAQIETAFGLGSEPTLILEGIFLAESFKLDRFKTDPADPGERFVYRPDFWFNAPDVLKTSSFFWQELAP